MSCPQVPETSSNALDSSIPAFELFKMRWVLLAGTGGEVFVVAIGSSCCGDTSEGDFGKRLAFGK